MEDAVKLFTRMRRLSPLFWCLRLVEHFHEEGGNYQLARFSAFRLPSLQLHKRGFKRQTLCPWRGSENWSDQGAKRTVNRILRGRDACSRFKVDHCYWEKRWLFWEVRMWSTEDLLPFDIGYIFLVIMLEKDIIFNSPSYKEDKNVNRYFLLLYLHLLKLPDLWFNNSSRLAYVAIASFSSIQRKAYVYMSVYVRVLVNTRTCIYIYIYIL